MRESVCEMMLPSSVVCLLKTHKIIILIKVADRVPSDSEHSVIAACKSAVDSCCCSHILTQYPNVRSQAVEYTSSSPCVDIGSKHLQHSRRVLIETYHTITAHLARQYCCCMGEFIYMVVYPYLYLLNGVTIHCQCTTSCSAQVELCKHIVPTWKGEIWRKKSKREQLCLGYRLSRPTHHQ